jgi:Pyruvate/2-oxoacid:ferredoxin oxidoreductase delta subunit
MSTEVYRNMIEVMMKRGGNYSGLDVPEFYALVEELFNPEEAEINNALPRQPITAADMAKQMGKESGRVEALLEQMADKGLCSTFLEGEKRYYLGVPFMPGIFEYQFLPGRIGDRDKRIAELIHNYKKAYVAAKGERKTAFPVTRVITVDRKIQAGNVIHTYDQVATYIDKYDTVGAGSCFCRHAARLRGEDVHGMPMEVCMWFGRGAEFAVERLGGRRLSKNEARELLDRAEEAGLVHMSRNTSEDIDFLCNCDRWHCEVIKAVLKHPKPGHVFNSGFAPRVDRDRCDGCGMCIDRCPPGALAMDDDGVPSADMDRCFGCAVCASGCPENAIFMEAKPNRLEPPKTVKDLVAKIKSQPPQQQ